MSIAAVSYPIVFAWTFTGLWEGFQNSYSDNPSGFVIAAVVLLGAILLDQVIRNKNVAAGVGFTAVLLGGVFMLAYQIPNSRRDAIHRALSYDKTIAAKVQKNASFGEILFGQTEESKAAYLRNLKTVPLNGCPSDFSDAYRRHIAAWESRNNSQIEATWNDVLNSASHHGIDLQSYGLR